MSFSLRWLFAIVTVAAVFAAGFTYHTPMWAAIVFSLTLGILCVGTICGCLSPRSRPFWVSFSVVGWVHFIVNAIPLSPQAPSSKLFTRRLSYELWTIVQHDLYNEVMTSHRTTSYSDLYYLMQRGGYPRLDQFVAVVDITQELATLLLAVTAGIIASYCVRRSSKAAEH